MEADDKEMQCRALWVHRVLCAKDLSARMACREKVVEVSRMYKVVADWCRLCVYAFGGGDAFRNKVRS